MKLGITPNRRDILLASAAGLAVSGCASGAQHSSLAGSIDPFAEARLAETLQRLDAVESLQTGTAGELAFAAYVERRMANAGLDVTRQAVDAPGFSIRKASATCLGQETQVVPQSIVVPTGPDGITAPLRLWRDQSDTALMRDAIALILLPRARHSRLGSRAIRAPLDAAISGGARAVILITDGPTGETIYLNADYERPPASVPVALIGPNYSDTLLKGAREGASCNLVIDGESLRRVSANIFGRVTGRGPTVVVSTPRTGWLKCVGERGPGLAIFLALAEWAPKALPKHDLLFLTTAAHEYDNAGGLQFINKLAPKPAETALWVHLGAGFAVRNFQEVGPHELKPLSGAFPERSLVGTDNLLEALKTEFAGLPGLESVRPASAGAAGELQEIFAHGYNPAFGFFGSHYYHHTIADRLDKADPALAREVGLRIRNATVQYLSR